MVASKQVVQLVKKLDKNKLRAKNEYFADSEGRIMWTNGHVLVAHQEFNREAASSCYSLTGQKIAEGDRKAVPLLSQIKMYDKVVGEAKGPKMVFEKDFYQALKPFGISGVYTSYTNFSKNDVYSWEWWTESAAEAKRRPGRYTGQNSKLTLEMTWLYNDDRRLIDVDFESCTLDNKYLTPTQARTIQLPTEQRQPAILRDLQIKGLEGYVVIVMPNGRKRGES